MACQSNRINAAALESEIRLTPDPDVAFRVQAYETKTRCLQIDETDRRIEGEMCRSVDVCASGKSWMRAEETETAVGRCSPDVK